MPITLTDDIYQTNLIVIAVLIAVLLFTFRRAKHTDLFPVSVTQELKGLGILSVVLAHFAFMLETMPTCAGVVNTPNVYRFVAGAE